METVRFLTLLPRCFLQCASISRSIIMTDLHQIKNCGATVAARSKHTVGIASIVRQGRISALVFRLSSILETGLLGLGTWECSLLP